MAHLLPSSYEARRCDRRSRLVFVSQRRERGVSALLVQRGVSGPGRFEDQGEQVLA